MAVTINQNPTNYLNLSGNPLLWVFSSDATAQANFSYYVEVYVNAALNSTHQVFPESGIYAKFDGSAIAENNTSVPTLPTDINGSDANNHCQMYIKVFERYSAPPTDPPALYASATSNTVQVIKGKKELDDWLVFRTIDQEYIFGGGSSNKWLTDNEDFQKIRVDETLYFFMVFASTGDPYNLVVTFLDSAGATIGTATTANTTHPVAGIALTWAWLVANDPGANIDNVASIQLQINDGVIEFSDILNVAIDRSCAAESYQMVFLSQIGALDCFSFNRLGTKTMTTTAQSYQTTKGLFVGATYEFNSTNSQRGNFQISSNKKMLITSGWLSDAQKEYLINNLILSPYILKDGQRVANMAATMRFDKRRFDTLFNIEIDIDLGGFNSMVV